MKKRSDVNPKEGEKKYGDVSYADSVNKKYPIDTEEHVRAALSYWGMPKNRSKYSPEDQKRIGAAIHSAARKFGISVSECVTVDSLEGITQVEMVVIDGIKGVSAILTLEGRVLQYAFDMLNEAAWDIDSMASYIAARGEKNVSAVLQANISETDSVKQASYLSDEVMNKLSAVDEHPFFVPVEIKYGVGSNKQAFDQGFFQKAGAKFEGTPFFVNHSDLNEFGNANPVGSIVKFAGADETKATFIAYVSKAEGTLRQKIRESQALGDKGFVKNVSIEGIPVSSDFVLDKKTGIKHFHDLAMPTGIAIVNRSGLKGSQII